MHDNLKHSNIIDKVNANKDILAGKEQEHNEQMLLACKEIFNDTNGIFLGKWLLNECSAGDYDNDINPNKLMYYKAKRDIYNKLKQYFPTKSRIKIEIEE